MAGLWTGEVQEHRIGTVTSAVIAEKAATLALSMAPYHYSTANVTKKIKKGEAREYKDGVITQSPIGRRRMRETRTHFGHYSYCDAFPQIIASIIVSLDNKAGEALYL